MPYKNAEFLVETDWLDRHLHDTNLRLLEVTGVLSPERKNIAKELCFDRHHIPGAAFLDVASHAGVFSDPTGKFPLTWPTPAQFEDLMGSLGIDNDSHVVVYASTKGQRLYSSAMWCTRAWWIMHHFGVHCAVLNGALEKWISEGRPTTSVPGHYPATNFRADPQWVRAMAHKKDVLEALQGNGAQCVVDALPAQSYLGTSEVVYGPRKGHITGAISVPMPHLVDWETGVFVNAQKMRTQFAQADILDAERIITYCGGGGCATTVAFALVLLGHMRVAVYDNSLYEWGADPALPMTDLSRAKAEPSLKDS